jgi:predicted DNA-binding ribbon-helix-helix protein
MSVKEEVSEAKVKLEEETITAGQQATTLRLKREFQVQLPSIAERGPSNMQKRVT